jgi:ethanolamine utilization protein EutP (predicted NTPase)
MELQQINEAMMTFKTFDFDSKGEYKEKISWYLALCYIKSEQKEKAMPLLKNITNSENQFKKSASELLDLLK